MTDEFEHSYLYFLNVNHSWEQKLGGGGRGLEGVEVIAERPFFLTQASFSRLLTPLGYFVKTDA